ncbi:hypothetical protein PENSPDRAFT_653608 [Peniophora sp. CONT]|nr:hypothetical protein PENSPDRAFT_653608 [Peniophora sp. CONT]
MRLRPDELLLLRDAHTLRSRPLRLDTLNPYLVYDNSEPWQEIGPHAYFLFEYIDLGGAISSLHLDDLQVITFYPNTDKIADLIQFISTRARRVQRAEIWLSQCLPLLHALLDHTDADFVLFPRLEVLVLYRTEPAETADEAMLVGELTALTAVIELRKNKGAPLREVVLSRTTESWGIWDALKGEVQLTFV